MPQKDLTSLQSMAQNQFTICSTEPVYSLWLRTSLQFVAHLVQSMSLCKLRFNQFTVRDSKRFNQSTVCGSKPVYNLHLRASLQFVAQNQFTVSGSPGTEYVCVN